MIERTDAQLLSAIASSDRGALRELHDRRGMGIASSPSPMWGPRRGGRGGPGHLRCRLAERSPLGRSWRASRLDLGHRHPSAHRCDSIPSALEPRSFLPGRDHSAMVVAAEEAVLLGVEHGDLAVALGTLSPELRAVVQATVLDGLTTREAARLLKIPTGTVKTRMMRARTQLRGPWHDPDRMARVR